MFMFWSLMILWFIADYRVYGVLKVHRTEDHDTVLGVSKRDCKNLDGVYTRSKECNCKKEYRDMGGIASLFVSTGRKGQILSCVIPECYSFADIPSPLGTACTLAKVEIWNLKINSDSQYGIWTEISRTLFQGYDDNEILSLLDEGSSKSYFEGQLVRISIGCKKKDRARARSSKNEECYFKKFEGTRQYPFPETIFDFETTLEPFTLAPTDMVTTANPFSLAPTPEPTLSEITSSAIPPTKLLPTTTYPETTTEDDMTDVVSVPTATTKIVPIVPTTASKTNELKMILIIAASVIATLLLFLVCLITYIFRDRFRICQKHPDKTDPIIMDEIQPALSEKREPVRPPVESHDNDNPIYETVDDMRLLNGTTNYESMQGNSADDGNMSSLPSSPRAHNESNSPYSILNDFSTSPYSGFSVTDTETGMDGRYDSSYVRTPEYRVPDTTNRINSTVSDYPYQGTGGHEYKELEPENVQSPLSFSDISPLDPNLGSQKNGALSGTRKQIISDIERSSGLYEPMNEGGDRSSGLYEPMGGGEGTLAEENNNNLLTAAVNQPSRMSAEIDYEPMGFQPIEV